MSLENKRTRLRAVEVADAEFILKLRLDPRLNKHVSHVDNDIEKQRSWIKAYKEREQKRSEFYIVIEDLQGKRYGVGRAYNIDHDRSETCVGSWIMSKGAPFYMAFDSILIFYKYIFNEMGIKTILLDVRKENKDSLRTVEKKLGAVHTGEDDLNDYYALSKESFENALRTRLKGYIKRAFREGEDSVT